MVLAYTDAELDSFSFAELRDIVKKNGWDASDGDGSIPLSGKGRTTAAVCQDLKTKFALVSPVRRTLSGRFEETPPPAKTRGRGDSLLPKQLDFQSETMSPVLLTERYGWQLAPDARLKFRARKTLSPTETYKGDTTQALRRCGALLPQYVPLVCPSFASRDLARDPDNPDSRNGHHGRAGRDPWSILDYIRDSLYWPSDAIFIDSECFGNYCKGAKTERYHNDETLRSWLPDSPPEGWTVEDVSEDDDFKPLRNYRAVYKWAQRVSSVLLFFLSKEWSTSENCTAELSTIFKYRREKMMHDQKIFFVLLDQQDHEGGTLRLIAEDIVKVLDKGSCSTEIFDVSDFMDWLEEGRKTSLKEAAGQILDLRDALEDYVGVGDRDIFESERHQATVLRRVPRYRLPDLNNNDVRNRYLEKYQRRLRINEASEEDLAKRLPGIGKVRAEAIIKYRNSRPNKRIETVEELDEIPQIRKGGGANLVEYIEPFISLY